MIEVGIVGVEIVKTEEDEESGIKYLNINVSDSEVERKPDIVRLCADAGILEYVKSSGDAISRQAVIDSIKRYFHDEYYQRTSIQDCRDCLIEDVIKDIPPVTPQPKTGHWKRISIDLYVQHATAYYKCSECGEKVIGEHNYCQFCGAKMEGEVSDADSD